MLCDVLDRWDGVAAALDAWAEDANVTAAAVVAADPSRTVTASVGIDQDAVFAAASLTKPVFAMVVALLVERGAFDLDRPLVEYLDDELVGDSRLDRITARMALAHTTGLVSWRGNDPLSFRFDPGAAWAYSGEGYLLLQRAVESANALGLAELADEILFRPLGMSDSSLVWRPDFESRYVIGHDRHGHALKKVRPTVPYASASMRTTADDFGRFLRACLDPVHTWLFEPQAMIDPDLLWAMGWGIERTPHGEVAWQWGDDPGFKHFAALMPESAAVAIFTNSDHGATLYGRVFEALLPGPHPALDRHHRASWMRAMTSESPRLTDDERDYFDDELLPRNVAAEAGSNVFGFRADRRWTMLGIEEGTALACAAVVLTGHREARLVWVAVAEAVRRRGLARSLIYGLCRTLDLRSLVVDIAPGLADFFPRCGFAPGSQPGQLVLSLTPV